MWANECNPQAAWWSNTGMWRIPEMGVPLVRIGFPIINQQFWGSPHCRKAPYMTSSYEKEKGWTLVKLLRRIRNLSDPLVWYHWTLGSGFFNGHATGIDKHWRYLPSMFGLFFRPKFQGMSPPNIAKHMVPTYLHVLDAGDLPLKNLRSSLWCLISFPESHCR